MRNRPLIGLLMPATAALLAGILIGTYVVAPIVEGGATAGTGGTASPRAGATTTPGGTVSAASGS